MKKKRTNQAISDIIGTMLLLAIAVALFSVLSYIVISYPEPTQHPSANLVATIDENQISIKHKGGDTLNLDDLTITISGESIESFDAKPYMTTTIPPPSNHWCIGEYLIITLPHDIYQFLHESEENETIIITIVDTQTNSIVLRTPVKVM